MARIDPEVVLDEVTTILNSGGGKMKYAALSEALTSQGKNAYLPVVQVLAARGSLVKSMEFHEGDSIARSTVSLPGGGA